MKILRKGKPHKTAQESYKHIIGDNGEDIQEYSSSSSYTRSFSRDKWDVMGDALANPLSGSGAVAGMMTNDNIRANHKIMKTDFRNGNYLRGIKHGLFVSRKTREQFKNGTYGS